MATKKEPIEIQDAKDLVEFMQSKGVERFKLGDLEVVFRPKFVPLGEALPGAEGS